MNFLEKAKENKFLKILKSLLSSKFFPLCLIPVSLLCYYLSLDMVMIYIIGILGTLIFILLDDTSPLAGILLFMAIFVSEKNSPFIWTNSHYYYETANLVQIFIMIALFSSSAIYRAVLNIVKKKFRTGSVFFSLCAFAVALMLNGVSGKGYTPQNLLYGLIMALSFCGVFCALKDDIFKSSESFLRIAYGFLAFGITITVELVVKYVATENIISNGTIDRELLTFGWGIWNTIGMYFVLCIPFVVYLAGKEKFGYIFLVFSAVLFAAAVMSCSRQSIGGALLVYPLSLILMFIKGRNRIINAAVLAGLAVAFVIFVACYDKHLFGYFISLFKKIMVNGEFSGNGRMKIWRDALSNFKSSPVFGAGFYADSSAAHFSGLNFVPTMAHNTVMQLLSSCGIIGLIVYSAHRVTTCISYFRNITVERTYLAIALIGFLVISLFDNHVFNIFPTIIYSALIAFLVGSEKKI